MAASEMLFSERSIWTMIHGIGLGGAALIGLAAALFYLTVASEERAASRRASRAFAALTAASAMVLWLAVLVGTYVIFPAYRAAPPAGAPDLVQFPRSLILANSETAWLHAFAMELKEHAPWIAAMLSTSVAFVAAQNPSRLFADTSLRTVAITFLALCFALVAFASLMGVFVNKVAPLH
jgi:hypothetical protein